MKVPVALHAPGELRVQDVNAPVHYADPDPPAAEAAGVGVFGVDAIPAISHLLKFEVTYSRICSGVPPKEGR